MKLVRIIHYRCGEFDSSTYLLAPDDITEEQLEKDANTAFQNHINAIEEYKNSGNEPLYRQKLEDFPGHVTIAEAQSIIEKAKEQAIDFEKKKRKAFRSFGDFMVELGYILLGFEDEGIIPETYINWGHRHGDPLNMSSTGSIDFHPFKEDKKVKILGKIK